jgi:hypothetical protein
MIRSFSQTGLDRLHQAMAARVAQDEVPGMVLAIANREDVYVDTIGAVAFGSRERMRRDTIFRIASMTKPSLGMATMLLVEDGALALDEPVDRLLPELAQRAVLNRIDGPLDDTIPANRPITVEDLLTFRLGHGMVFEPTFQPPYRCTRRLAGSPGSRRRCSRCRCASSRRQFESCRCGVAVLVAQVVVAVTPVDIGWAVVVPARASRNECSDELASQAFRHTVHATPATPGRIQGTPNRRP